MAFKRKVPALAGIAKIGTFYLKIALVYVNKIIVIAASKGGLDPLRKIIAALPNGCEATVFIVVHIGNHRSDSPHIISWSSKLAVSFAQDEDPIKHGHIYVAPPDHHMTLTLGRIHLTRGPKIHHTRPAADPLFVSAARTYKDEVIGIVLSGGDNDGAEGLRNIKEYGGRVVVQKPEEALDPSMPETAIARDHPDACLSVESIAKLMETCGETVPH